MVEAVARAVAARRHEAVAAEVGGVLLLVDRLLRHLWGRGEVAEVEVVTEVGVVVVVVVAEVVVVVVEVVERGRWW